MKKHEGAITGGKTKLRKALKIIAVCLASLLLLILTLGFTICKVILDDRFSRVVEPDYAASYLYSADELDLDKREIAFKSGGNTLRGYVWGDSGAQKLMVISHGLGGLSNHYFAYVLYFASNGYRVMTYDNTGVGRSGGKRMSLPLSAVDLHSALSFIENDEELKSYPVYLFGHSWGGHAVASVLNYGHECVKAVVSVAGYNSHGGIMLEIMKNRIGLGWFAYPVYPFAAFWVWCDSRSGGYKNTAVVGINKTEIPVLIVQGGKDITVWEDSIYNHRDEITNPNVEYYFAENQTHRGIISPDGADVKAYIENYEKALKELRDSYEGDIPEDKEREFYKNNVDKSIINDVNHETATVISEFFAKY